MSNQSAVEYFIEDIEYHGRNERTAESYRRVLTEFESYVNDEFDKSPVEVDYRDCMAYVHDLRTSKAPSTVATYASYLNRFYTYLESVGRHDENPVSLVIEEMDESIDTNPQRRDLSLPEMRAFVADVKHPLHRAIVVTLLKTGIRSGELCNLDLKDVNLRDCDTGREPRPALSGRPNSIYVPSDHTYGQVSDGEMRTASNKRKRSTTIPIDDELRRILIQWLAIRPDPRTDSEPLFMGTVENWGTRLTPNIVHHIVETHAREAGWYRTGGSAEENVTPHYFRHFFTTYLRDSIGDRGVVKYLRGDVGDDVIDTYTHDWGDRIRETYLNHIYTVTS